MSAGPARYQIAIFDFDGTLADTADWAFRAMNEAAAKFGYRAVDEEELAMLRGLDNREIIRRLGVPMWRLPAIARHFRAEAARDAASVRLFPGASDCLAALRARDIDVAILSSNAEANIRAALGPSTAALVSHFACGADLFGKAAKMRRLLRGCRLPAEAALAIGDETRDIQAAREAGLACAGVSWGYATREALERATPDAIVDSFAELQQMLGADPSAEPRGDARSLPAGSSGPEEDGASLNTPSK